MSSSSPFRWWCSTDVQFKTLLSLSWPFFVTENFPFVFLLIRQIVVTIPFSIVELRHFFAYTRKFPLGWSRLWAPLGSQARFTPTCMFRATPIDRECSGCPICPIRRRYKYNRYHSPYPLRKCPCCANKTKGMRLLVRKRPMQTVRCLSIEFNWQQRCSWRVLEKSPTKCNSEPLSLLPLNAGD